MERRSEAMANNEFLKRHGIVRNAIKEDMIYFAAPALIVFTIGLVFCAIAGARAGLTNFWGIVWGLIKQPRDLFTFPMHSIMGLATIMIGFIIMLVGQITLYRNYSSTVVIREDHQLITHGIYRFARNPVYLGLIMVVIGFPVFVASLYGFVTMLVLIPIILNRIRLEEKLLTEEFQDAYQSYKETTKKLIPFIY
jgi:protein-S-isoprenylcysteine O-methyltransferase Ste14